MTRAESCGAVSRNGEPSTATNVAFLCREEEVGRRAVAQRKMLSTWEREENSS